MKLTWCDLKPTIKISTCESVPCPNNWINFPTVDLPWPYQLEFHVSQFADCPLVKRVMFMKTLPTGTLCELLHTLNYESIFNAPEASLFFENFSWTKTSNNFYRVELLLRQVDSIKPKTQPYTGNQVINLYPKSNWSLLAASVEVKS